MAKSENPKSAKASLTPGHVRLRVLRGAITIGKARYDRGHTFVCTVEFAAHLDKQFPGCYETVLTAKTKKNNENDTEVNP